MLNNQIEEKKVNKSRLFETDVKYSQIIDQNVRAYHNEKENSLKMVKESKNNYKQLLDSQVQEKKNLLVVYNMNDNEKRINKDIINII